MNHRLVLVVALFALAAVTMLPAEARLLAGVSRKDLAGPPSDFAKFVLPSPSVGATEEKSTSSEMWFKPTGAKAADGTTPVMWQQTMVVDSTEYFAFAVASPVAVTITVVDPSGKTVEFPKDNVVPENYPIGDSGGNTVPVTTYVLPTPIALGTYEVTAQGSASDELLQATTAPNGLLVAFSGSTVVVSSAITDYGSLKAGQAVGLTATLTHEYYEGDALVRRRLQGDRVVLATMEVIFPDGSEDTIDMNDAGLLADVTANDGIYTATMTMPAAGVYVAQAQFSGELADGTPFTRSSSHVLPIAGDEIDLTNAASVQVQPGTADLLDIVIGTEPVSPSYSDSSFRVYTEVWATSVADANEMVPVAWLANIQEAAAPGLMLALNQSWLQLANAQEPLQLRNVVVQDVNTGVPVATVASIAVQSPQDGSVAAMLRRLRVPAHTVEISREMKYGRRPAHIEARAAARAASGAAGQVTLLHGYCAGSNPFEDNRDWWPKDSFFFSNPDDNISNDEYAQLVLADVEAKGVDMTSLIGHSQGGLVSTHILQYYWSTLDTVDGSFTNRLIQSVGSPYLGNSGAGFAADVINVFGFACGSNTDLTRDGAALWGVGISPETRAQVYFYTTQYSTSGLIHYCSLATNLVLKWPNDGTAELDFSFLNGGTHVSHEKGYCHTDDMHFEAQYDTESRMRDMAQNAAK